MRALFETTAVMGASQVVLIIIALVRNKIIAVFVGQEGMGVMGNTLSMVGFLENFLLLGFQVALLRYASEKVRESKLDQVKLIFSTTLFVHLLVSVIGISVALVFLKQINISIYQSEIYSSLVIIMLLGIPLTLFRRDIVNLLNAFNMVKGIVKLRVLGSIISMAIVIPLIILLSSQGVILFVFVESASLFLVALYIYRQYLKPKLAPMRFTFSKTQALTMFKYGGVNQVALFLNSFSAYALRIIITAELLLSGAGLFNSAMALGGNVLHILSAAGIYYYPKISAIHKDHQAVVNEANNVWRFFIILLTPAITVLLLLASPIIRLLYSVEFLPIVIILGWILAARFFQVLQGPLRGPIIIMEKYRAYLIVSVVANITLLGSTYFLVRHLGLLGAGVAQAISYAMLLLIAYIAARNVYGFRMRAVNWGLFVSALGLLALAAYGSQQGWAFRAIPAVAVLVWLRIVVKKQEWISLWGYIQTLTGKLVRLFRRSE